MTEPPATASGQPARVMLIALSAIADDPRVRRMGDYLHARGWDVIGVGLAGARTPPPAWAIVEASQMPEPLTDDSIKDQPNPVAGRPPVRQIVRNRLRWLRSLIFLVPVAALAMLTACALRVAAMVSPSTSPLRGRLKGWAAILGDPRVGPYRLVDYTRLWFRTRVKGEKSDAELLARSADLRALRAAALAHPNAVLIVANDWITLPVAAEAARMSNAIYVYDSHEFATEEYAERLDWRLFQQPLVRTIEARHIPGAAAVTSVSPGISQALRDTYALRAPVITLRNMPRYEESAFRPSGARIRVLYHGVVGPGRGLEEAIASLPGWPDDFDLTIRGPGTAAYIDGLAALARDAGCADRVVLEPPVPANLLVREARGFDIGLMALPGHSEHNAFALPNKVFEYLMAGLALCVSDLPEMARVVRETGSGVLCGAGDRDAIAASLQGLSKASIDDMKRHALEAAKALHFEADAAPVAEIYTRLVEAARSGTH